MDVGGSFLRRPYQVVYRSAKYSGSSMTSNFSRLGQLGRLVTGHLLRPLLSTGVPAIVTTLALTPLLLISGLFLFLFRETRYFLVKVIYPDVQICQKFSRPSFPQDSILWFRGPVQFDNIVEKLMQIPQLRKKAQKRLGLQVLENQFEEFQLENHIIQAPQFFQNLYSPPGQKPVIQRVVSHLCSMNNMSEDDPTWTLTMVPCPIGSSLLLLRAQSYLQLQKCLLGLNQSSHSHNNLTSLYYPYFYKLKQKGLTLYKFWQKCSKLELACEIWHRLKVLAKLFKSFFNMLRISIRASHFFAVQIHRIIFSSRPSNGFRKTSRPNSRLISWSEPISSQLVLTILEKINSTTTTPSVTDAVNEDLKLAGVQSLFLTVCSLALAEYYRETNLVNPGEVGLSLPPHNQRITIPTKFNKSSMSIQLKDLKRKILSYPSWKMLGHRMVELCLDYFIPEFLADHFRGRLGDFWPISFSYLDIRENKMDPGQLRGSFQIQEMTTFPQSDSYVRVTVVQNFDFFRVSVSSSAQGLDVALTRSLSAHLDQLAESVGLERSRRSSPKLHRHL